MHWIDATEAMKRLNVKRKTLYTYASRGWIDTRKQGRRKLYRAENVASLRERALAHAGREARAAGALSWGIPVLTTAISAHDVEGPYYRGVSALACIDLPLESVAERLWDCGPGLWPEVQAQPVRTLLELVPAVLALQENEQVHTARLLVRTLQSAVGLPDHPTITAAMVLCADHGLNASTFATRVAASTGATLPACVATGLCTLSGPQHGTASLQVMAELEIQPATGAVGFTHRFYPRGDPRGEALLRLCPPRGRLAERIERMKGHGHPTLDVGLLALCEHHELPPTAASLIFAVGRSVGWIAHVFEQRASGALIRPRARYIW